MSENKEVAVCLDKECYEKLLKNFERDGYRDLNDYILHIVSIEMLYDKCEKSLGERFVNILSKNGIERRLIFAYVKHKEGTPHSKIAKELETTEEDVADMIEALTQKLQFCI